MNILFFELFDEYEFIGLLGLQLILGSHLQHS